jgi:CRISPR/Cas system-associated exonuclease Cas4 (RecB family)
MVYKLSPSKLNLFLECPLCFWLSEKGIRRPSGPFPSLPGGMDRAIKRYFDKYRAKGELPPEIKGKVVGKLFADTELLTIWRNARKGLSWTDENGDILFGAVDDILEDCKNLIVVDYKTYGGSEINEEEKIAFYQNQLDCYALLLEKNGYKHPGFAYLIFFISKEFLGKGLAEFDVKVVKVKVDSSRALKNFNAAIKLIKGKRPAKHSECTYCAWAEDIAKFE